MVFSSHVFLFLFLPLVLVSYYLCPRPGRNVVLLGYSLLFYGWANPLFALLLLLTVGVCYLAGQLAARRHRPEGGSGRIGLLLGVVFPLLVLGVFKYFNFARDNWNAIAAAWGPGLAELDIALQVVLPLGLSFYTFQAITYVVDIYRGDARPQKNPLDFASYIALFPQLVAGPIIRYGEIERQLRERRETINLFARGVGFFSIGLAKKILLANPCGQIADAVFATGTTAAADAWTGVFAYSMQIYFDFSGYSDMALGLGLMFGFVFPINFNSPYRSVSITDFWRRWHISLSSFLRDYLYIPLGGNRKGNLRTYANLITVMLLGGLWHGASWTFVVWGAWHGVGLAVERLWNQRVGRRIAPTYLAIPLVFVIASLGWVWFRADSFSHAAEIFRSLFGLADPDERALLLDGWIRQPYLLLTLFVALGISWFGVPTHRLLRSIGFAKAIAILLILVLAVVAMSNQSFNPFIYFNF
ncbi:MBOAT family O-acyltransferase [Puniceicoccus vermicola]|uniref:MBOAT family protein n=1 Tax=Puniceicoccus vermicola TaxID=388746 RepID=A0A7X1E353_9BACT|nr:MBOAT family protein [Puniceicoccus vermicola]MBC2601130.1 MBOAT family protein [Puniceicoccus vermicola]